MMLDEHDLAALALTSRLANPGATPLPARKFWQLSRHIEPSKLRGMTATAIAAELAIDTAGAERLCKLFDRSVGLALSLEELDHSGIWTITGVGKRYPARLRARLADAAPVVLHGVGDVSLLSQDGVGVVGSRNVADESSQIARQIAQAAVKNGLPVVSGAARGIDKDAMNAAFHADGHVVGVLAESLERTVARPGTRRGIADGRICLVTPYQPTVPFSVGNAMGRNKIIYGLSRCTIVVVSDNAAGGTWDGATEALRNHYGRVAAWTGRGSGPGNTALVERGAVALGDLAQVDELLHRAPPEPPVKHDGMGHQLALGI